MDYKNINRGWWIPASCKLKFEVKLHLRITNPLKTIAMLQLMKIHRLISLKKQYNKLKSEAVKLMTSGDLKGYLEKLTQASKLRREFSETLNLKV